MTIHSASNFIAKNKKAVFLAACICLLLAGVQSTSSSVQDSFDIVIRQGRVMDPESGRDEIANVGIRGSHVAVITTQAIRGKKEIDATGLVVAPGFIDTLSPTKADRETHIQKVNDGVTTTFSMHGTCPLNPKDYDDQMQATQPLLNYGCSIGDGDLRRAAGATDRYKPATEEQIEKIRLLAGQAICGGAAGIGFAINVVPGASYEEVFALFEVAAKYGVPAHVHARYKGNIFPQTMTVSVMEVLSAAAATGAEVQLVHLTSSTVGSAPLSIRLIEGAARNGVRIGFDFHVWTRNEGPIQSAIYDEGWQDRFGGLSYDRVWVSNTQERLTKERFEELRKRKEPILVQSDLIHESEIEMALRSPVGHITSDGGGLDEGKGHPRSVGTFARFLRLYIREKKILPLMEGLRRITLLPAQRLENGVSAMKKKGRLQEGSDADITVFDPATVRERATYEEPSLHSEGIHFVLINGKLVLEKGSVSEKGSSGKWMRHVCSGTETSTRSSS